MASLSLDNTSKRFRIQFRYGGRQFQRSLKTANRREALAVHARVEETIRLLERGTLDIPPDGEPGTFIISDGRKTQRPSLPKVRTLRELFRLYRTELPDGAKEATTIEGEIRHIKHLLRHLGSNTVTQTLTVSELQRYVQKRSRDRYRGELIKPETIKKELTTFRLIWNWAVQQGYLSVPSPTKGIKFPKSDEKPPFMTWDDIEHVIGRGGCTEDRQNQLWSCLFLTAEQIERVLVHAESAARHPFVFPMFVFVCHTGARRSEILRSQIDDFDFRTRTVQIREKKKSRSKAMTFRHLPMTDLLHDTMSE